MYALFEGSAAAESCVSDRGLRLGGPGAKGVVTAAGGGFSHVAMVVVGRRSGSVCETGVGSCRDKEPAAD